MRPVAALLAVPVDAIRFVLKSSYRIHAHLPCPFPKPSAVAHESYHSSGLPVSSMPGSDVSESARRGVPKEVSHEPLHPVTPPPLRGDGEQMPFAGHALELVSAAVFELES